MEPAEFPPVPRGGAKRCPECDLACQAIAAGNTAPRDPDGRPLPFPPDYLAAKIAERQKFSAAAKTLRSAGRSKMVPGGPARIEAGRAAVPAWPPPPGKPSPGRSW